jgi:hypothetical protein
MIASFRLIAAIASFFCTRHGSNPQIWTNRYPNHTEKTSQPQLKIQNTTSQNRETHKQAISALQAGQQAQTFPTRWRPGRPNVSGRFLGYSDTKRLLGPGGFGKSGFGLSALYPFVPALMFIPSMK